jgi:hypothetical protein
MASINMGGCQGFILNDIKNEIRQGRVVTHVLNVTISRWGEEGTGVRIVRAIFECIANTPITKLVLGKKVTVTWRTSAKRNADYYFCDNPFTNLYVVGHTELLLRDIVDAIDATFNHVFTRGETGIGFVVTNPALHKVLTLEDLDDMVL